MDTKTPSEGLKKYSVDEIYNLAKDQRTSAVTLDAIAHEHITNESIGAALVHNPALMGTTLVHLAQNGPAMVVDMIARDTALLAKSAMVESTILSNPQATEATKKLIHDHQAATEAAQAKEKHKQNLYMILKGLTIGQKIGLAKKGNKDVRSLLIRDPNKMIALEVVNNPRITDGEILSIAAMKDVAEDVLRAIANSRLYRQNKEVVLTLLHNPRTPVGVSLGLGISGLSDKELEGLAKSRNIPGVLSKAAKTILEKRKLAQKPKI